MTEKDKPAGKPDHRKWTQVTAEAFLAAPGNYDSVRFTDLDAGRLDAVIQAIHERPVITAVDMSSHRLGDEAAGKIAGLIRSNPHLTHLNISGMGLGDGGSLNIAEAVHENRALRELDMSGNAVGDAAALLLSDAIINHQTLNKLGLGGHHQISDMGRLALIKARAFCDITAESAGNFQPGADPSDPSVWQALRAMFPPNDGGTAEPAGAGEATEPPSARLKLSGSGPASGGTWTRPDLRLRRDDSDDTPEAGDKGRGR